MYNNIVEKQGHHDVYLLVALGPQSSRHVLVTCYTGPELGEQKKTSIIGCNVSYHTKMLFSDSVIRAFLHRWRCSGSHCW